MKSFAVVLFIISFVCVIKAGWTGPKNDEFKQKLEDCKAESNASDDDVQEVLKTHQASSKAGQCLMGCIQMKTGLMNADFTMDIKKAEVFLTPMKEHNEEMFDKLVKILKECKAAETTETDKCVAAKKFANCMKTKGDAAGITMKKN